MLKQPTFYLSLLTVFLVPSVAFADFADVNIHTPNATSIINLQTHGVLSGYSDGTFRPNQSINRAELMKIIVQGALKVNPTSQGQNCFPDVGSEWFAPYVCYAFNSQWVKGYPDGKFHPEQTLTEAEALKMIVISLAPQDTVNTAACPSNPWYALYLCEAEQLNIVQAADFNASSPMTRGLAAAWLDAALPNHQTDGASADAASSTAPSSSTPAGDSSYVCLSPGQTCNVSGAGLPCCGTSQCTAQGICSTLAQPLTSSASSVSASAVSQSTSSASSVGGTIQDHMLATMAAWKEARKTLSSKMEDMSHQPNGSGCFSTLSAIDNDWVENYNNYVLIYNNLGSGDWTQQIQDLEQRMADVQTRIDQAPTYCD